jgi:alginate O-acetyltransferase complex protein AlgJ
MKAENPSFSLPAVIVFLLVITLPLADRMLHFDAGASRGGRQRMERPKKRPADSFTSFLKSQERIFNEHLFLRGPLIHINNSIRYRIFAISAVPKVIVGRQGWLFQARENEAPGTARYFSSIGPFSSEELDRWRASIHERRRWLNARGIGYLFIPVPDKSSIYPEYLPENLQKIYRRSRLDQLIEFLKKNSDLPVLDVRPALLAAKRTAQVYAKTDSHWNDLGARIVAGEIQDYISASLAKGRRAMPHGFGVRTGRMRPGGNLAMMLTLENSFFREEKVKALPDMSFRALPAELPPIRFAPSVAVEATRNGSAPFANAVMFHDSFGRRLKPYLSELFSRIVYVRDWGFRFAGQVVEKERPAIVLDEIAEHFLYNLEFVNDLPKKNGI